jgi:predicted small secreted protein
MCHHAIIDADILVYRIGFATDKEDQKTALRTMAVYLEDMIMFDLPFCTTWTLHLTGKGNFRDDFAVTRPYKANRKGNKKPTHYEALRDYLAWSWDATIWDGMEADDAVAIEATELGDKGVIVSLDKDLDQVVGHHYNFAKGLHYYVDEETAKFNFYMQFLTGDVVDNIEGVRGIGPKRAKKLLEGKTETEMWDVIVELLGEERAIENGHLLYMLRHIGDTFSPPTVSIE